MQPQTPQFQIIKNDPYQTPTHFNIQTSSLKNEYSHPIFLNFSENKEAYKNMKYKIIKKLVI